MVPLRFFASLAPAVSVALLASVWASPAQAAAITYTASGSGGDGSLAASATITTGAGVIDITLTNTLPLSSFVSVGQTVSDLSFTLSNSPGTQGTLTASGQEADISSTGMVMDVSGSPVRFVGEGPPPPGGTGSFTVSGDTITMEAIGGGQPTELITPLETTGSFPDTNPGIDSHNPYTIGSASFVLDFAGVTAGTTVNAATFSFGTGPDTFLPGTPTTTSVPEPLTLSLFGAGLLGAAAMRRRKKKA